MDYFPFLWNAIHVGIFKRFAAIRHFAGELPFLHLARDVADKFIHCHYVGGGVAAAREGTWVGYFSQ